MSTAHYLHHLANQPRQFTQADERQLAEATEKLKENRVDFWTNEGSNKNTDLIWEFFQKNRSLPVTIENIYRAVEQRKTDFVWLSQEQVNYFKIAVEDIAKATELERWLATQGQPAALVNSGDQAFENMGLLLAELRGRSVTPETIHQAEGRISFKPGRKLHYVPLPRREYYGRHSTDDDPNRKDGVFIRRTDANKTPLDYAREREEALAKNMATPQREPASVIESRARAEAESLRGNTHSQDARLARMFVNKSGGEIDWPATLSARRQMQARFSNRSIA
jgi:hypothetical protein